MITSHIAEPARFVDAVHRRRDGNAAFARSIAPPHREAAAAVEVAVFVHASTLIAAGLAATLGRLPNVTVKVRDDVRGTWLAEEHADVDIVFVDSECIRRWQSLNGHATGPTRRPRVVWVAPSSAPDPEPCPGSFTIDARLSVECDADDVCDVVRSVTAGAVPRRRESVTGGLAPGAMRRVLEHIKQNLSGRIELSGLARIAGLSQCHFARAFKQSVGAPPHRYVMSQRIEVAAGIIARTDAALSDVALEVGFCDQSHFTRLFSRALGESPRAYRRRHR